jgi:hypothetical protein
VLLLFLEIFHHDSKDLQPTPILNTKSYINHIHHTAVKLKKRWVVLWVAIVNVGKRTNSKILWGIVYGGFTYDSIIG